MSNHHLGPSTQQILHFGIKLEGKLALDSGQSTGGFSDCLLQYGIKHVYGIDVGYGQLHNKVCMYKCITPIYMHNAHIYMHNALYMHNKVRQDPRVTVIERTNLRTLSPDLIPRVDIACLDLSFISVLKCIPAVVGSALKADDGAELVVLIKPQFEAGREGVERGGIVKDPAVHQAVLKKVVEGVSSHGFRAIGQPIESPIKGDKGGNTEFLAYFIRDSTVPVTFAAQHSQDNGDEEEDIGNTLSA
jgi:23S rRNA (cytidine1920-2'-O)/16S rRNA (cytidine1409-2'-O)-methyltransferase